MKRILLPLLCLGFAMWVAQPAASAQSPAPAPSAPTQPSAGTDAKNLVVLLKESAQFKKFYQLLLTAELLNNLQGSGPFTVFAPTDEAFSKLPGTVLDDLMKPENKDKLKQLLSYHIANGKFTVADLGQKESLLTWTGEELEIDQNLETKTVQIDDAEIKSADLLAANGILHTIDRVLQP